MVGAFVGGLIAFACRGRWRFYYGLTEVGLAMLTTFVLYYNGADKIVGGGGIGVSHSPPTLVEQLKWPVATMTAVIYLVVRGLDNIGHADWPGWLPGKAGYRKFFRVK